MLKLEEAGEAVPLYLSVKIPYNGSVNMEELSQLLEEELADAVEVKNRKSLHRYVMLLTQRMVEQREHEMKYQALREDIREGIASMERGFARMDERFAVHDGRFEAMNARFDEMNKRFEDMNLRFEDMNARFEDFNRRFEDTNKRFEDMNERFEDTNKRFEDMNERFEDMNKRFDEMSGRFEGMQKLIGLGFTLLALFIAGFNSALLFFA
jgi:chromosome segregation ATPase